MKNLILFFFASMLYITVYSQDTIQLYLNSNFEQCKKKDAVIIRKAVVKNNSYFLSDMYLNGQMIVSGNYCSANPWIEDGESKYYDEIGQLYSVGNYNKGKLTGKWIYYKNNKPDTVDYSTVENYQQPSIDASSSEIKINVSKEVNIDSLVKDLTIFTRKNLKIPARVREEALFKNVTIQLTINKEGQIQNPVVFSKNNDICTEIQRSLFLYKCKTEIKEPLDIRASILLNNTYLDDIDISQYFQNKDTTRDANIFVVVEEPAKFQNGDINSFRNYIQHNLIYPFEAAEKGIKGKVIVQFTVNSKGTLLDAKVVRGVHPSLDNEVLRCIYNSPIWEPARQGGENVAQQFTIPIIFNIQ